ncbi:hypothetical protein UlMin_034034 [Ulmus minor]
MRRFSWSKLKSSSTDQGQSRKELSVSLSSKMSVNKEYLSAFRTKSYEEIWDRVQGQIETTNTSDQRRHSSTSSPAPPFLFDHLSEYLLEPRQETLKEMNENLNFHQLLIDYFEASLKACDICESLLQSIHQMRSHNRKIKRMIKMSQNSDQNYLAILRELRGIALLKNPFSIINPLEFRDIHDFYFVLFHQLTSKVKKIKRKAKIIRMFKKVGRVGVVISHSALLIALLVFAFHGLFGIVAAPALIGFAGCLGNKKKDSRKRKRKSRGFLEGLGEQLDVAARGIFILINDFDTMSQMVRRLNDEVEHRKSMAEMCVRNRKCELIKEVVKEIEEREGNFLEQLEELEGHIYLSLLTINRSRRLVLEEILQTQ